MEIVRYIDDLGRVVLPLETRQALGWAEKTPLTLHADPDGGTVVLKRHRPSCIFCGNGEALSDYRGKSVCPSCRRKLAAEA